MAVNLNKLTDGDFEGFIAKLHKRIDSNQMDIQRVLVAILSRWEETGDIRPAVKHVNLMIDGLPSGVRSNAIRAWVETFTGFVYATDGENKGKFVAGKLKAAGLNIKEATAQRWWEFKPEPTYKPMDFEQQFAEPHEEGFGACGQSEGWRQHPRWLA